MKKIFLMAAVAAAVLSACSKSETTGQPEGRAMKFSNAVIARGATAADAGQFNIFGYKYVTATTSWDWAFDPAYATGGDIYNLNIDKYKRDGGATPAAWTGMYYYDGVSDYSFYGYADTKATTTTVATSFEASPTGVLVTPGTDIAFAAANNNQIDLVTMATGTLAPAAQTQNKVIIFKHALSRVRFTAYTETVDALSPIVITGITFTADKNSGDVTWANMGAGTMTNPGGSTFKIELTGAGVFQTALDDDATTPATVADDVFYAIPQNLAGTGKLKVEWTVAGVPNDKEFNLTTNMVSGNSYNFNIKINLNQITFEAWLEEWAVPEVEVALQ